MKQLLLITAILIFAFSSCNNKNSQSSKSNHADSIQSDRVEVLYFHGKQRCITCRAIELHTKELLDSLYNKELGNGKVTFRIIDISTKEGEAIADKYEVTWSSLFINQWREGKERRNNMTEFAFSNAKGNPKEFKVGLEKEINQLLK